MAKESKVNSTRRELAQRAMVALLRNHSTSIEELVHRQQLARLACEMADAMIHEFDDRGWQ